jgi:tetratricopeptide (TPR) repeat protein
VSKEKMILIGGVLVLILGLGLFFFLRGKGEGGDSNVVVSNSDENRRENMLILASEYADQGEYDMALDLINDLLLEDAADQEARALRDRVIKARKEAEEADKQAELDALKAQNEELAQGLKDLSNTLQNQESPAEKAARLAAEEEARRKKLLQQQQVEELINQAKDAIQDKDYDKAISLAKQALSIIPDSYDAQRIKKEAEDLKRAAESEAEKKAREEREKKISSLLDRADKALDQGDFGGARNLIDQVLELDPENGRALSLLGQSWYRENSESKINRDRAREYLKMALEEDPQDWETHYYLGKIADNEGDDMEAMDNYVKAASLNGSSPEIFYSLGILQYRNKLYKEALSSFKRVEGLKSDYTGNYYAMGLTYNRLDNRSSALDSLLKSCKLRPDHSASFYENRQGL